MVPNAKPVYKLIIDSMNVILGKRDYENTANEKYPKYNLNQLNIYVSMNCPTYSGISLVVNLKCFDMFGKYKDEINKEQEKQLDEAIKDEYGMHNVDIDHLIDWDKFEYNKKEDTFTNKIK